MTIPKKVKVVGTPQALNAHTKALYEAGASLLKDSAKTGRDYCKDMLGVCFTAIPVYVGLIKLFVPEKQTIPQAVGAYWVVPIVFFLLAALAFSAGYLPGMSQISLELPETIKKTIDQATKQRFYCGTCGFVLLSVGILASIKVIWVLLSGEG